MALCPACAHLVIREWNLFLKRRVDTPRWARSEALAKGMLLFPKGSFWGLARAGSPGMLGREGELPWLLHAEGVLALGQQEQWARLFLCPPSAWEGSSSLHPSSHADTSSVPKRHSCPSSSSLDTPVTFSGLLRPVVRKEWSPDQQPPHHLGRC